MSAPRARRLAPALALALALGAGCRRPPPAPPPSAPPPTIRDTGGIGTRALDRMKELAGNWTAGEIPISFEVMERGHAITQRGGFFVIWHADGNDLGAAVFAHEGYHARMRSKRIADGPNGELIVELETVDTANVDSEDPIVRSLELTISPTNDAVTQRWSFGENLDTPPRELKLTRAETGALPPTTKPPAPTPPPEPAPAPTP